MLVLDEAAVRAAAQPWRAVQTNRGAFESLELGEANVPPRIVMGFDGMPGSSLFKPCSLKGGQFGVKAIHVRPENGPRGLATTPATIMIFDQTTGAAQCLMNGTFLTALRTAAGSAAATDLVAPKACPRLVVFGAGLQGEAHVKTVCCVRQVEHVVIVNRGRERADQLVEQLKAELGAMQRADGVAQTVPTFEVVLSADREAVQAAVQAADVVCTTTGSPEPLFDGAWLKAGAHVNAVGSYQDFTSELDTTTVARARVLVVDTPDAWGAGDLKKPLEAGVVAREDAVTLGQLGLEARGIREAGPPRPGTADKDITLFKSVGCAVQDVATAALVYEACCAAGNVGTTVSL